MRQIRQKFSSERSVRQEEREPAQRSGSMALPPSVDGSVPMLLLLFVLTIGGTVSLYLRHERSSPGDWSFAAADAHRSSCLQGCDRQGLLLLLYRATVLAIGLYTLSMQVQGFMFYTVWNFALLTAYFGVATANSLLGCCRPAAHDDGKEPLRGGEPEAGALGRFRREPEAGLLQKLQLLLLSVEIPAAILLDLVVWTVLVPESRAGAEGACAAAAASCTPQVAAQHNVTVAQCVRDVLHNYTLPECEALELQAADAVYFNWGMYMVHGLNSVFMLVELCLNRLPIRPWHVFFTGWWATAYCIFQCFIWFPLKGQWMYPFMYTGTIMVIPWMLGLLLLHWTFFGVACVSSDAPILCCRAFALRRASRTQMLSRLRDRCAGISSTSPWSDVPQSSLNIGH